MAVHCNPRHSVSKSEVASIRLLAGFGVEGDAHAGRTVKHRSRVARDPTQPNLRQVHVIPTELHRDLSAQGFDLAPGQMGENITTAGLDVLGLPRGTRLRLGDTAVIEVTGLRNPCRQLDGIHPGLMEAVLGRAKSGEVIRKAGIMTIVLAGGRVEKGNRIAVEMPEPPHAPLRPV